MKKKHLIFLSTKFKLKYLNQEGHIIFNAYIV